MGKKGEGKVEAKPVAAAIAAPVYRKLAVVGCSDSKTLAPYDDKSWDLWAMNNAYAHVKRATAWFEIHPLKKGPDGKFMRRKLIKPGVFDWATDFRGQNCNEYVKSLAALNVPIYMQKHWDEIPSSIPYPLKEVLDRFGNYFTNSVSYMIALGIMQGYNEIGCWGVDMATACFTGDTEIQLSNNEYVPIQTLTERGGQFNVWSRKNTGELVEAIGHSARVAKKNAELVAVCFDNDNRYRCTPDHPFMMNTGSYKQARSLTRQDELMGGARITKILNIKDREDVFDITVDKTHNFILRGGICAHNSEYGPQRPSCEFFLGIAAGMGIKITVPDQADLLKTKFLYGFGEREQTAWEKKTMGMIQSMEQRKQKAVNQVQVGQKQVDQYIGALEAVREMERIWSNWGTPQTWRDPDKF